MRLLLCAATLLACTSAAQAPPEIGPPLPDEVIVDLVRRLPAFAPGGGRTSISVARKMAIPGSDGTGHFAEVAWREGERFRGGLLGIGRTDAPQLADSAWAARRDPWGILEFKEDETWDDLIRQLGDARDESLESSAIGRLRTMASAQITLAAVAGAGFAGDVECLLTPSACGLAIEATLLDPNFREAEWSGYRFTLHAGTPLPTKPGQRALVASFAYTAVPTQPGRRSFCTDDTGKFCERPDGRAFEIRGAACPAICTPLR
jgi:hypothetical protein